MQKIAKLILFTLVLGAASLFLAVIISFLISQVLPGDRILPYLPEGPVNPEVYQAMFNHLGLNRSGIEQFFIYLYKMLMLDWGLSLSKRNLVFNLITERIPLTLSLIILPLILGLILGLIVGNYSMNVKSRKGERFVQILSILGFSIPILLLTIFFPYFLSFINSIFHLVLLWISLTISIMALTILLVRIYLNKLSKEVSENRWNVLFISLVGVGYGIVFILLLIIEIKFSFGGLGELLLQALSSADYYVINGIIFLILFSFPIFIIFILFSFFLFGRFKKCIILHGKKQLIK